jgi:hypothetical protein
MTPPPITATRIGLQFQANLAALYLLRGRSIPMFFRKTLNKKAAIG